MHPRAPCAACADVDAICDVQLCDTLNRYDPVLNLEKARDSISKDELTPEQHAEVMRLSVMCDLCVVRRICGEASNHSPCCALQFDLWDDAPTLDEEEELLESGGIRSSMAVLSVSEGGSADAAAGGGS